MSHRYRVLKTTVTYASYAGTTPARWTPYCPCGWVGSEGPQGPAAAAERAVEFLDHLRALDPETAPVVDVAELQAKLDAILAPSPGIITDPPTLAVGPQEEE